MKFSIRDDDLNFFFDIDFIEKVLDGIWDVCPVSMSVIPEVKGHWRNTLRLLESISKDSNIFELHSEIVKDNKIFDIFDNDELVSYINKKIGEGKVCITQHGVYHRNEDNVCPTFNKNFGIGAEFYTDRDLSTALFHSNQKLKKGFNSDVKVFTPPQNLLSKNGLKSIMKCNLNICGYMPSPKDISIYMKYFGIITYLKLFFHRLRYRKKGFPYPKPLRMKSGMFIEHVALQPGTDLNKIYKSIDYVNQQNGSFVLSTHTYAFEYKMEKYNMTMKEALLEILRYVERQDDVKFVPIDEMFGE